jgi:hypothetical protein
VRVAGVEDLDTVARLALVEIEHRSAPPMFAPPVIGPWPAWPPGTAPCTKAAPSTFWPPWTGATPAHHRADLTGTSAPPPPCPARAGEAPGTRSPTPRSPGPMPMATKRSRSIPAPLTRCPGHSGSTSASTRPDTASCVSSTAARRINPGMYQNLPGATETDHWAAAETLTSVPLPDRLYGLPKLTSDRGTRHCEPIGWPAIPNAIPRRTDNLHAPTHICLLLQ